MKPRKILLIVLVVLVLAALMYKMSERYVYSNAIPMDVQTLLEAPEPDMKFSEEQKEFLITTFNMKTMPPDPKNIIGTFTQNQKNAIEGVFTKYMPSPTRRPKYLEFVDSPNLNYSYAQKEFILSVFTSGLTDPETVDKMVKTMNKIQAETFKKEYQKYTNYMNSLNGPVKKFVPPNVMEFKCFKQPGNTFACSFS